MTSAPDQIKRALVEIRRLKKELESTQAAGAYAGPIAIVGTGLRLPGGISDLDGFEALLNEARHVITEIPPSRWHSGDAPTGLPQSSKYGAFLDQIDMFDPEFFGISGTEAASMDPQQRLVLETGWEALEQSGHAPNSFSDKPLGIFLGLANSDYGRSLLGDMPAIDPYFTSGSAFSVASGRLAYFLGSRGPAISLDTACSSSLVAIHLACHALKSGECDIALAGGANVILSPEVHVNFSRAGMLASDGLCKTFDDGADGYVRGEGCILFVLRRLEDAQADGDNILAIIRGSAINQDGRSNGLTAPNGPAQEALIKTALDNAGVKASTIGYVEAHGTGTPLGDPIEMNALARAYGRDNPGAPTMFVGSVKTNLGHLESAAGAVGVLKSIVALRSGVIPVHLNFKTPNVNIDWQAYGLRVPVDPQPWPKSDEPRRAGVSAFGFSGTNAHLVLEQAPLAEQATASYALPCQIFPLSARSVAAASELASRTATALADSDDLLSDLCFTAAEGRAHFQYRLAVAARDKEELSEALQSAASGKSHPSLVSGRAILGHRPKVAFLFTGQGAQHPGMGRELYQAHPVYRDAIDECNALLEDVIPTGLLAVLHAEQGDSRVSEPSVAQPALFAMEYALAKLWMSFGVTPDALCGHSLGEFVAATISGILPLEDALLLVAERGRLSAEAARGGMMASVFAGADAIAPLIKNTKSVEIAAYNGPNNHVLSGHASELEPLLSQFAGLGIRAEALRIAFAAHCALVDPVLDRFRAAAEKVRFQKGAIPIVSNLTGAFVESSALETPDHWTSHLRQPVRFADAIETLRGCGITHFIEIGPHPVLCAMAAEANEQPGARDKAVFLASLRRNGEPGLELATSLARLYVDGAAVDPACLTRHRKTRRVSLPTYPFERTRHWHESAPQPGQSSAWKTDVSWDKLATRLDKESERGPLGFDAAAYPAKWQSLADLRRALIIHQLRESKLFAADGEQRSFSDITEQMRVINELAPLVGRWIRALAQSGDLEIVSDTITAPRKLADPDLASVIANVKTALNDNVPLCDYVLHCANLLGPVLRGEASPLETLFPGGDFSLALGLYERSSTMRYMNDLAAEAVQTLAASERNLTILEVGAGTGGTTAAVLNALDGAQGTYCFTDVSDLFLDRARERFAGHERVSYARFDLETPPGDQGFQPASFDIILASNAVHAVRNLPETLAYLRSLLCPSGVLILIESTTHFAWFDVTTGLIEGWRHAEDNLRDDLALMDEPKWRAALLGAGFNAVESWPRPGSAAQSVGQHLIAAKAPGDVAFVPADTIIAQPQFIEPPRLETAPEIASALEVIAEALPSERAKAIGELVRLRVVMLLRRRTDRPPGDDERLRDMGLDSLMAVQLRNALAHDLEIADGLPTTLVFDYPTIGAMSAFLSAIDRAAVISLSDMPATKRAEDFVRTDVTHMTDEEVEALLLERLNR
jgi:acyl transferase domain-containing protein/SAM-dependent methyltransferase